jgi:hypothetical protein
MLKKKTDEWFYQINLIQKERIFLKGEKWRD